MEVGAQGQCVVEGWGRWERVEYGEGPRGGRVAGEGGGLGQR